MIKKTNDEAGKDLLELADIATDKQIEDIKKQKCKRKEEKTDEQ
jgi:hypothetical protein